MDVITVGSFLDPRPYDAQFSNIDIAMGEARKRAARDPHFAVAVWTGHLVYRVLLRGFELVDPSNNQA